jgi:hypothetical protein
MYGTYKDEFAYQGPDLSVSISGVVGNRRYSRGCNGSRIEKNLASGVENIIINPVEPVNLPDGLTQHLEIVFEPVVVRPGDEQVVYLTFPIETGVFLESGGNYDVLDIFSLVPAKYSLYGLPESGCITRWYQSNVFSKIPDTDILREGVMELVVRNSGTTWTEVSRAVFLNTSMHLYYGDIVSMSAIMEIWNPKLAETKVLRRPVKEGLKAGIELYTAKKIPIVQTSGYLMEHGVS